MSPLVPHPLPPDRRPRASRPLSLAPGLPVSRSPRRPRAFTLIELLTVIAIIAILTAITIPAIRSLTKSNDQSQGANLVRSMVTNARSIAIAQHRMAGVVFFEETRNYSMPVHGNQTAMQLFVEAYNQTGAPAGTTGFFFFSTARQYLPEGVKLASLTDIAGTNVETGDPATTLGGARAILFDSTGSLVLRGGLFAPLPPAPGSTTPGSYADNSAYGDWKFNGSDSARSYPGFFLYNKAEFDAQPTATARLNWLKQNSSSVIVNGNTGGVLK